MIPRSLSASSLQVAQGCLARWKAEYLNRGGGFSNSAASVGTSFHYAAEKFVEAVYLKQEFGWDQIKKLEKFYMEGYVETFGNANFRSAEYKDGWDLCKKWHKRTDLSTVHEIVSVEKYMTFPIPTSIGEVPFNYIMDRFDILEVDENGEPTVIRVVDYKTIRIPITPEELRDKIQAKAYAVMARIQFPKVRQIWVQFDLVRHDTVSVVFDYDDCVAIWNEIVAEAERIIATPESNTPETLNMDCRYCSRAPICKTLNKSIEVGSILGMSIDDIASKKLQVQYQLKGLTALEARLDEALLGEAVNQDALEYDTADALVEIKRSRMRKIRDTMKVAEILGPELTKEIGNFSLTQLDNLMKSGVLTDEQVEQIQDQLYFSYGDPKAKVKEKSHV